MIPSDERFVGFAGDNLHITRQFYITPADENCSYNLILTFNDNTVRVIPLAAEVYGDGVLLTWTIRSSHLPKGGVAWIQLKVTDDETDAAYYTGKNFFIVGSPSDAEDGDDDDRGSVLEARILAILGRTLPYIGADGYWYVYDAASEAYQQSRSATPDIDETVLAGFVPTSRRVAGLSLSADLAAAELSGQLLRFRVPTDDPTSLLYAPRFRGEIGYDRDWHPIYADTANSWEQLATSSDLLEKADIGDVPAIIELSPVRTPPAYGDDEYALGKTFCYQTGSAKMWVLCGRITLSDSEYAYGYQWVQLARLSDIPDISDKADLADIPTKTSDLTNDSGFLTAHQDISGKADIADIPTKTSDLTNDSGFLTNAPNIYIGTTDKLSTENGNDIRLYLVNDVYINKTNGKLWVCTAVDNVNHLWVYTWSDKGTIRDVPTKTSDLTNDSGFLTAHQDISGKMSLATEITTTAERDALPAGQLFNLNGILGVKMDNDTSFVRLPSYSMVADKENTSNKVTTISSASTNAQYPSALAVYTYVNTVIGGIENGSY